MLPARVLILGGGVAGKHAAEMAIGHGADVTLYDISAARLEQLDDQFGGRQNNPASSGLRRSWWVKAQPIANDRNAAQYSFFSQ